MPPQELCNAGRDALWRAAAGYEPCCHTRFSTYAVAAILNGMRDVLAHRQQAVPVPRQPRAWVQQLRSAAAALSSAQQAAPAPAGATRLQQLAAAAQLAPRQVEAALAAARPQRLVGFGSLVRVEPVAGACRRNHQASLALFGDVQQPDEEGSDAAAEEAVQLVLARLRRKHADVLRLRFGLQRAGAGGCSSSGVAGPGVLDFTSVGRQLGMSRQGAQKLYHAAVASARREAALAGLC